MSASERILNATALDAGFARETATGVAVEQEVLCLFDEFRRPLLRYVGSFGLDAHDAEDVVQDVFLALFRHLRVGGSRQNLAGWLFSVAHNLALRHRRQAKRRWWLWTADPESGLHRPDPDANPEERLVEVRQHGRWQRVLAALPERDRRCVVLRAEGLKYRDIATTLGISLGTVAKTMARALERFGHAHER